jgi:hypothetical protein
VYEDGIKLEPLLTLIPLTLIVNEFVTSVGCDFNIGPPPEIKPFSSVITKVCPSLNL